MRARTMLTGGFFAACIALSATAAPASAADGWQRTTPDSSYNNGRAKTCALANPWGIDRAKGCFQPYGEWIWLQDLSSNNEPVGLQWWYTYGSSARSGVAYWNGTATAGWTSLNKSFTDGGEFRFRVCEVNLSTGRVVEATCSEEEKVAA